MPLKVAYPLVPIDQVYVDPPLIEPLLFKVIFPPVSVVLFIVHPPICPDVLYNLPPGVTLNVLPE